MNDDVSQEELFNMATDNFTNYIGIYDQLQVFKKYSKFASVPPSLLFSFLSRPIYLLILNLSPGPVPLLILNMPPGLVSSLL